MKIIFIKGSTHHKNFHFILKSKLIQFFIVNNVSDFELIENKDIYDAVVSPCFPFDVSKYPNIKFIFGPHFSVFPEEKLFQIISGFKNIRYNCLSDWNLKIFQNFTICSNIKLITLPFGVDTDKFCEIKPIEEKTDVVLYFKHRDFNEFHFVENILKSLNVNFKIFSYQHRYSENDYLQTLQNSKYMVCIDAHESQGFALQEAMACNVPLLVWSVKDMSQETITNYDNKLKATSVPYFDERCGEVFYEKDDFISFYAKFIEKLENYKPREYILENLSMDKCEKKWIEEIKKI
jgi:hypothetical protein